jgi:hypothetical protein
MAIHCGASSSYFFMHPEVNTLFTRQRRSSTENGQCRAQSGGADEDYCTNPTGFAPYWTEDEEIAAAQAKLKGMDVPVKRARIKFAGLLPKDDKGVPPMPPLKMRRFHADS